MTPLRIPLHGTPCVSCQQPADALIVTGLGRIVEHGVSGRCWIPGYDGPHARQGSGGRPYDPAAVRHNRRKGKAA